MEGATTKSKAGINLNPYQGLKQSSHLLLQKEKQAGINLNPYQGLKRESWANIEILVSRRNQPKSLSGIETRLSRLLELL